MQYSKDRTDEGEPAVGRLGSPVLFSRWEKRVSRRRDQTLGSRKATIKQNVKRGPQEKALAGTEPV